jgi:hypothetical protein
MKDNLESQFTRDFLLAVVALHLGDRYLHPRCAPF